MKKNLKYQEATSDMAGYEALAAAIVQMAYVDFVCAEKSMRKTLVQQDSLPPVTFSRRVNMATRTKYEVRKFFQSKWYSDLCGIDRKRFLRKLDEVEAAV